MEYYTYVWRDASGVPFYVGKGKGSRYLAANDSQRSREFMEIHSSGGCSVEIVDEFFLESEALAHEVKLVEIYGRRDFGGTLVNKTDGGEGTSGAKHTKEFRAKIGMIHKGKVISDEYRANLIRAQRMRHNKGGFKGVRLHQSAWVSEIRIAGKRVHIGRFGTAEDAAKAYDERAKKAYGIGNCYLNFPNAP